MRRSTEAGAFASAPKPLPRADSASRCITCLITDSALRHARPLRLHVHRIQGLAAGHEQAIALRAAEADVAANLRQENEADASAVRGENVDAVVAVAYP